MARSRETKIELTAYDDLFQTDESREEAKLSKINAVNEQVIKGNIAIIKHTDNGETQIETPEEGAVFEVLSRSVCRKFTTKTVCITVRMSSAKI